MPVCVLPLLLGCCFLYLRPCLYLSTVGGVFSSALDFPFEHSSAGSQVQCSIERDRYKSEVELLEVEKNQIACQCEELKAEIAQLKASIPQAVAHANNSTTSNVEDSVNFSDGESLKLRSLRVNVGQLLATIMPDLDLQQVNYDIDVVDEILGQVVEQMHEISST